MNINQWWHKLRATPLRDLIKHKHKFVVMDTDTFKEKISFQLSGINLFVFIGVTVIVLILLTTILIAFTPLRELIPGYTDTKMIEQTYINAKRIDSISAEIENQEWLIATLQGVLRGDEMGDDVMSKIADSSATLKQIASVYRRSHDDSVMRSEVEREDNKYQIKTTTSPTTHVDINQSVAHLFFAPVKGNILNVYNEIEHHYGVDIGGALSQPVVAAYSGTVVSSSFTANDGHVIIIQHPGNVITVYKNNSSLLKHQGDVVRAGMPIAFIGTSGAHSDSPYLHFEVWVNGSPVNPGNYISF